MTIENFAKAYNIGPALAIQPEQVSKNGRIQIQNMTCILATRINPPNGRVIEQKLIACQMEPDQKLNEQ